MGRMGYEVTEASGEVSGLHAGIRQGNPTPLPEVSEASRRPWSLQELPLPRKMTRVEIHADASFAL